MAKRASYIVTGGAGFIGSNLVAAILSDEPDALVTVVDDFRNGSFAALNEACDRHGVAAFTGRVIPEHVAEIDWDHELEETRPRAVFHLAAITDTTVMDERLMISDNADSFRWILDACVDAGVPLVYASSAATYGAPDGLEPGQPFPLEAAGRPNNVYGFSKWLMEVEHRRTTAQRLARGEPVPRVFGLRYFNVFGPGESRKGSMASMVYQLAAQMTRGKAPRLFKNGEQARDQVHVDDVVGCTLAAAGMGGRGDPEPGVYNCGSGVATSFNAIVSVLRRELGIAEGELLTEFFDMPPIVRQFYQDYTCADMSVTEWGLGWKPKIVPEDGMATYARLLREHFAHYPPAGPPAGPSAELSTEGGTGESAATSGEPVS